MSDPGTARSSNDALPFHEVLRVPLVGWLIALAGILMCAVAFGAALGRFVALATLLVGGGAAALALHRWTGHVSVDGGELLAGRARLPISDAGAVTTLDPHRARWLRGPGADPRAYLYLRSWIGTAVQVEVTDPSDPAPYWYVSTRRPDALALAIDAARRDRPVG